MPRSSWPSPARGNRGVDRLGGPREPPSATCRTHGSGRESQLREAPASRGEQAYLSLGKGPALAALASVPSLGRALGLRARDLHHRLELLHRRHEQQADRNFLSTLLNSSISFVSSVNVRTWSFATVHMDAMVQQLRRNFASSAVRQKPNRRLKRLLEGGDPVLVGAVPGRVALEPPCGRSSLYLFLFKVVLGLLPMGSTLAFFPSGRRAAHDVLV